MVTACDRAERNGDKCWRLNKEKMMTSLDTQKDRPCRKYEENHQRHKAIVTSRDSQRQGRLTVKPR